MIQMKVLGILMVFLAIETLQQKQLLPPAALEYWNKLLEPFMDECLTDTGVQSELVDRMVGYLEFPEDRKLKCFVKCQALKLGFINYNGEVKVDAVLAIGIPHKIIDMCRNLKRTDVCETTFQLAKCMYPATIDLLGETPLIEPQRYSL